VDGVYVTVSAVWRFWVMRDSEIKHSSGRKILPMPCGEVSLSSGGMENAIGRELRYFLGCPSSRFFFLFASGVEILTWELSFR
jgi:hypothetical protein